MSLTREKLQDLNKQIQKNCGMFSFPTRQFADEIAVNFATITKAVNNSGLAEVSISERINLVNTIQSQDIDRLKAKEEILFKKIKAEILSCYPIEYLPALYKLGLLDNDFYGEYRNEKMINQLKVIKPDDLKSFTKILEDDAKDKKKPVLTMLRTVTDLDKVVPRLLELHQLNLLKSGLLYYLQYDYSSMLLATVKNLQNNNIKITDHAVSLILTARPADDKGERLLKREKSLLELHEAGLLSDKVLFGLVVNQNPNLLIRGLYKLKNEGIAEENYIQRIIDSWNPEDVADVLILLNDANCLESEFEYLRKHSQPQFYKDALEYLQEQKISIAENFKYLKNQNTMYLKEIAVTMTVLIKANVKFTAEDLRENKNRDAILLLSNYPKLLTQTRLDNLVKTFAKKNKRFPSLAMLLTMLQGSEIMDEKHVDGVIDGTIGLQELLKESQPKEEQSKPSEAGMYAMNKNEKTCENINDVEVKASSQQRLSP